MQDGICLRLHGSLLLWYLVYLCTKGFSDISRNAGYLMIPYLVWLTFAGYLNFFIFLLN